MGLTLTSSEFQVYAFFLYINSLPPAILGFQDPTPGFCLTLWASSQGHVSDRPHFSSVCIVPTPQAVSMNWDWEWKQAWEGRKRKRSFHDGAHKTFCILSTFTTKTHITTIPKGCQKSQDSQHFCLWMEQTLPQARLTTPHSIHPNCNGLSHAS